MTIRSVVLSVFSAFHTKNYGKAAGVPGHCEHTRCAGGHFKRLASKKKEERKGENRRERRIL
jgi:hypothetical protein